MPIFCRAYLCWPCRTTLKCFSHMGEVHVCLHVLNALNLEYRI